MANQSHASSQSREPAGSGAVPAASLGALVVQPAAFAFDWTAGDPAPDWLTFTGDANRTYFDANGILHTTLANVPRVGATVPTSAGPRVPAWLIEGSSTNWLKWSRDFTNAAWAAINGCTAAFNSAGLDGTLNGACTLTDGNAAGFAEMLQTVTIANDSNWNTFSVFVLKDAVTTRAPQFKFILSGGTTLQQCGLSLNTATGQFVAANVTGVNHTTRVIDAGLWWRIEIAVQNNSTGNTTAQLAILPAARATYTGADSAAAIGSIVVGHAQLELNQKFSTSPILTTTAALTRAFELPTLPWRYAPLTMTIYASFVDLGLSQAVVGSRLFQIGANADPRWLVEGNGAGSIITYVNGHQPAGVAGSAPGVALESRSVVDLTALLVTNGVSLAGAAEVTTSAGLVPSFAAFSNQVLTLGEVFGGGAGAGPFGLRAFRIAFGVQSMDQMRGVTPLTIPAGQERYTVSPAAGATPAGSFVADGAGGYVATPGTLTGTGRVVIVRGSSTIY